MKKEFKTIAIFAAQEAGRILMSRYKESVEINLKNELYDAASIVTKVDVESEEKIIEILKKEFPAFGIHGEESGERDMDAEYIWYIDPLDGTSNYTRHIPLFGVSIGLVYKGEPVLGILYFPALNILVSAEKDKGCFLNGELVKVSNRKLTESLYYAGGKFKGQSQLETKIAEKCGLVKILDSSSFELAQIAMGDAEIYYLANVLHDVVAGVCIVREAGGVVTDGLGNPWQLDSKMILVTNGVSHREIIECLVKNN